MSVSDGYTQWSSSYDKDVNRTRDLDHEVTRKCLGGMRFSSILEIGCGTGKNTSFLASLGGHVLGMDFSSGMLNQAKSKVTESNVAFVHADLNERWPVADQSVDLISCNLVLEHIERLSPVFQQARRCLTPGGLFWVSELHPARQYLGSQAHFHDGDQTIRIDSFVHHLSDFLAAAEMEHLRLQRLEEWWHEDDEQGVPRLISFLWQSEE